MPEARPTAHVLLAGSPGLASALAATPIEQWAKRPDQGEVPWAINESRCQPPQCSRFVEMDDESQALDGSLFCTWWMDYLTREMWAYIFGYTLSLSAIIPGYFSGTVGSCAVTFCTNSMGKSDYADHNYDAWVYTGTLWLPKLENPYPGGWRDVEFKFKNITAIGRYEP